MEDAVSLNEPLRPLGSQPTAASINNRYAAFTLDGSVWFQKLDALEDVPDCLSPQRDDATSIHAIALSPLSPDILAFSDGSQIRIYDLVSQKVLHQWPRIGRPITALAWHPNGTGLLAAGFIDGTIALWSLGSLEHSTRPLQLVHATGAVTGLAFSVGDGQLLASAHGSKFCVWSFHDSTLKLIWTTHAGHSPCSAMAWRPRFKQIFVATTDGKLNMYDVSHVSGVTKRFIEDDDSDDDMFGGLDEMQDHGRLSANFCFPTPVRYLEPVGESAVLALDQNGQKVHCYRLSTDADTFESLGCCRFSKPMAVVILRWHGDTPEVVGVGDFGLEHRSLPFNLLGNMDLSNLVKQSAPISSSKTLESTVDPKPVDVPADKAHKQVSMKPVKIAFQRMDAPRFARTARQLRFRRESCRKASSDRSECVDDTIERLSGGPTTPQPQSMVSSLELPKYKDEEGSPMPFLSPSIPSRRASPNEIPPLDDVGIMPAAISIASLGSSLSSANDGTLPTANDSDDSDDETFVEDMHGSSTFLPGGINVPLPKACGALFAQNGQLLTFFPPKSTPAAAHENAIENEAEFIGDGRKSNKVARLFPTFGNLTGESVQTDQDTDSDGSWSINGETEATDFQPHITLQAPSFSSQPPWKFRASPTKSGFEATPQGQQKIFVIVHSVSDVTELFPAQRDVAQGYRFLCADGEPTADLCDSNASVAEDNGLLKASSLWRLLGMLLRDEVPLDVLSSSDNVFSIARRVRGLSRNDSGVEISRPDAVSYGKLRWADHPFGGPWLVRRVLGWAEQQADMQLLATMVAVLGEGEQQATGHSSSRRPSLLLKLPTYSVEYLSEPDARSRRRQTANRAIPILRTETPARVPSFYESPTKVNRSSNTSSRNPSLPPTPYLDSMSDTSPVSFQNFSQPGSRFSNSGSASPEYHRGSFSAAAKYYAQSFTDKFASYGTSPPAKKLGTSPSTSNELSTSLPSGSWSKSVSFASISTTANTNRGSLLSTSYDAQNDDGGYDSDKTVEDHNMPYTPRSPTGAVAVSHKNEVMFSDDICGHAKVRLVPEDLVKKSKAWCGYYAEQLRSWDLLMQAAELEMVVGITQPTVISSTVENDQDTFGIHPTNIPGERSNRSCAICFTALRGIEQLCSQCLHTSHITCLEDYVAELGNEAFTCPAGCGCSCAALEFVAPQLWQQSPDGKLTLRKKSNITDPGAGEHG